MQTPPARISRIPKYKRHEQPHKTIFYWELEPVKLFLEAFARAEGYRSLSEMQRVENWNLIINTAQKSLQDANFSGLAKKALQAIQQISGNKK